MDISDVTKASGLPASTLRYYEERGLIQPTSPKGQRRTFHASVVEQLALISLGQSAGLSLDEIASMFTENGTIIDRALLLRKADEIDQRIRQLTAMRNGLRHAAACDAPSHLDCPNFRRLLRRAGKSRHRHNTDATRPGKATTN